MCYSDSRLSFDEKKSFDKMWEELLLKKSSKQELKDHENTLLISWIFPQKVIEAGVIHYLFSKDSIDPERLPEELEKIGAKELSYHAKRVIKFLRLDLEMPKALKAMKERFKHFGDCKYDIFWEIDDYVILSKEACQDLFWKFYLKFNS